MASEEEPEPESTTKTEAEAEAEPAIAAEAELALHQKECEPPAGIYQTWSRQGFGLRRLTPE